jgi:osmotically-inducible protein OsmY
MLAAAVCVLLALGACRRAEHEARPKSAASHATQAPPETPAAAAVAQAERALEAARREVATRKEAETAAEKAVAEAEKRAEAAAEALAQANETAAVGNDVTLFRAVQTRLLGDAMLAQVGISARVRDGAVTLWGRVPDAALRDRAVAVARETPGVRAVENEIEVDD